MGGKLFTNGNTWPSIITILLTVNLAGIGYLAARINFVNNKLDVVNERGLNSSRDIIYLEKRVRDLPNEFAKREWVLQYFETKKREDL